MAPRHERAELRRRKRAGVAAPLARRDTPALAGWTSCCAAGADHAVATGTPVAAPGRDRRFYTRQGTRMGSNAKKKTTMAKLTREHAVRERRLQKQAKKDARKQAAARQPTGPSDTTAGDVT